MSNDGFIPPGECPVCGEDVPGGARSCPSCGADEQTGWDEDETRYDGLGLPDEAFDDIEVRSPRRKPWHQSAFWAGVALVLLIILMLIAFRA